MESVARIGDMADCKLMNDVVNAAAALSTTMWHK
jgi:hypothetical protein